MSNVVAAAESWTPRLGAMAPDFESARRLPADVAAAFAEAGMFNALVPKEYGGLEVHPREFVDMIKAVARGDGSAGWNVMIGSTTGLLAASLPEEFAQEIYAPKGVMTVGVTAPLGRADIVEGGYRVTGRWPFGSGSQNADWICGGSFVYADGERIAGPHGPEIHLMMFRASDVEIEDTWHVAGLRGTGSHHIAVENCFVPMGRSVVLGGKARFRRPLYQFPMLGLLALGVSSVSLGIGFGALDAFLALAGDKKPTGSSRALSERALVQANVARAVAALRSAEAFVFDAIDSAWALAERGERLPQATKAELRLAAANATHQSVAAVDMLYQAGGGSSIYESSALQRCFRDIHVTTQHIMVADPIFEVIGRTHLGLEPKSML